MSAVASANVAAKIRGRVRMPGVPIMRWPGVGLAMVVMVFTIVMMSVVVMVVVVVLV